jgi:hypothetical protein
MPATTQQQDSHQSIRKQPENVSFYVPFLLKKQNELMVSFKRCSSPAGKDSMSARKQIPPSKKAGMFVKKAVKTPG